MIPHERFVMNLDDIIIVDKALRELGDVEGHPFHGNQWTGGFDGGSDDTVRLYRGDAQNVNPSLSYSDPRALFGAGIYLTDSKRVAGDYTSKGAHEGVVLRYDGGAKGTKQDAIDQYKRQLATTVDKDGNPLPFPQPLHGYSYTGDSAPSPEWKRRADEDTARLRQADKLWKQREDQYIVRKQADGLITIREKSAPGTVAHYEIPRDWVSKTLDAEDEIPKRVAGELHDVLMKLGDRQTARDLYNFATTPDEDGFRPSFRKVFTSIVGGPLRESEEGSVAFRRAMKDLGYKGIRYQGGVTMGGARHEAFVFWDEQGLKKVRALGDVEGHPFHGNQWTEGSGTTQAVEKVPANVRKELPRPVRGKVYSKEEIADRVDEYLMKHYGLTAAAQAKGIADRERGVFLSRDFNDDVLQQYGHFYEHRIASKTWQDATKALHPAQREEAFVKCFADFFTNPTAQKILSLTNPLGAIVEIPYHDIFKSWGWVKE
jgi:hypothetical protein